MSAHDHQGRLAPGVGESGLPGFEPHPLVKGPHAQTIVGRYMGGQRLKLPARAHQVALADGDRLLVLESVPSGWEPSMPAAVLVHGLAGSADANYVVRVSRLLLDMDIRVVRVNLRGSGQGFGLARQIYHAGRSEDLRQVVNWLHSRIEGSPIALIGFSLGASLVLKAGIEAADAPIAGLDCLLAANAPIDLVHCARMMRLAENRVYNWNFVRWLRAMVDRLHREFPDLGPPRLEGVRTLYEFDDRYTAPKGGFASADDYYTRCSVKSRIGMVALPGLVVHAMDDPFIGAEPFLNVEYPRALDVELVRHGGHLGYLSRTRWEGTRRWLDLRLTTWLRSHWAERLPGQTG
jgi:predicted alpha/beta-fold hydrolase